MAPKLSETAIDFDPDSAKRLLISDASENYHKGAFSVFINFYVRTNKRVNNVSLSYALVQGQSSINIYGISGCIKGKKITVFAACNNKANAKHLAATKFMKSVDEEDSNLFMVSFFPTPYLQILTGHFVFFRLKMRLVCQIIGEVVL